MSNNVISVPAIVEMMKEQKTYCTTYNGTVHYGYSEAQLKSLVEQILQVCSLHMEPQPQLHLPNVMRGGTPEPLAFLFQKLKEVDAANVQHSPFLSQERDMKRKKITDAIQLIREIMLDANGA